VRVSVVGVRLYVDVQGAKLRPRGPWLAEVPTVVIVHTGPGADHLPYKEHVGPHLAQVAQVVYVDLRGHGRSDLGDPGTWRVETFAADLHALCERLGIERPVVLGAGWGCFTVLRYAQLWPSHPSKLVLVNPNARFVAQRSVARYDELGGARAGEAAFAFFEHPSELTIGAFFRECFPVLVPGPATAQVLVTPAWNFELAIEWTRHDVPSLDLRPGLGDVSAPVLVIAGTDDPQYPLASIEEVVAALPDVRVERYAGARHSPFRDAPQSLGEIREFVTAP